MQPLLVILLSPFTCLLRGYVFARLWLWFVVPQFHCDPLRIPIALGLSLFIWFATAEGAGTERKDPDELLERFLGICLVAPLLTLGIGKLFTLFL